ncbi:unnamed protein product [Timema podura]|uniref:Diacylglycerol kinase accessory domain-containing protein n=1 Tax=Timema podura TaxID=61482 RepID=A0ABN7NHP4_TIMPD|nr:unnamed protein product [Timema podura]
MQRPMQGYTDEPISKILSNIAESEVVNLDRWELKVEKNPSAEPNEEGKDSLPLSVVNNYFSLGVDAHIALEFHEARVKRHMWETTSSAPNRDANPNNPVDRDFVECKSKLYSNILAQNMNAVSESPMAMVQYEAQVADESAKSKIPVSLSCPEAHPERFNSRLRNKMFYGQAGGKDLLRRKWKGLAELVTLECDGKDLTSKLKEHKVHAIVFLNIPRPVQELEITRDYAALVRFRTSYNVFYEQASLALTKKKRATLLTEHDLREGEMILPICTFRSYGGGTHPWNRAGGNTEPSTDDGLIEVVGLTTYQLPLLQAGGHGTCITQCKSARIVTTKTIPMQVDGEACKLTPSIISLSLLNKVPMLAKCKGSKPDLPQTALEQMTVSVDKISMSDYEQHHYEKDLLKEAALNVGTLEVSPVSDLEQVRKMINNLPDASNLSADWCFVDSCTAERFFRVDRAQEHLHFVMDIATDHLYVLDAEIGTLPQTPEDETAVCSPSGSLENAPDNFMVNRAPSSDEPSQETYKKWGHQSSDGAESDDALSREESPLVNVEEETSVVISPLSLDKDIKENIKEDFNNAEEYNLEHNSNGKDGSSPSIHDRLFGLGFNSYRHLLEKNTDGILKAAKIGDLKMLKGLHTQGYSLLSIDASGQTALHYGSRLGHKDIVKYLIACAPSSILNIADNDKYVVLDTLSAIYKLTLSAVSHVRFLVACVSYSHARSTASLVKIHWSIGQTALHKAAAHKRRSICCMLVAGGASLSIADHQGNTPRHLALQAEDTELAAYLHSQEHFQLVADDLETVV